jgi:4a-hydroxytetrahydrobiopterin dehydratase
MAEKLSDAEISEHLSHLSGWKQEDSMIVKTFAHSTFAGAIAFVTHMGFLAEAAGHHPDIDIRYNKVKVALTTHDAGGLSSKDFELAAEIDEIMA